MEIVVPGASSSHVFSDNLENPFIPRVLRSMKLGKEPAAMHLQRPSLLSKEWGKFIKLQPVSQTRWIILLKRTLSLSARKSVLLFGEQYRNYNDFANICDQLINDDNARLEIAVRNRRYVLENHSVYSRYEQLQRVLKKYDV